MLFQNAIPPTTFVSPDKELGEQRNIHEYWPCSLGCAILASTITCAHRWPKVFALTQILQPPVELAALALPEMSLRNQCDAK